MNAKELLRYYQCELGSSQAECDDWGRNIWTDIDCAIIEIQKHKDNLSRLEYENMILKLALSEARSRFKHYEMDCDESSPDHHRNFMNHIGVLLGW